MPSAEFGYESLNTGGDVGHQALDLLSEDVDCCAAKHQQENGGHQDSEYQTMPVGIVAWLIPAVAQMSLKAR